MKKFISYLTALAILASLIAFTPLTAAADFSGDGWHYSNGVLTVTADGGDTHWRTGRSAETFTFGDVTAVVIQDSVTRIWQNAFSNCINLTSVTIGNSVTTIGTSAFSSCINLTSVTIPNSVVIIDTNAFAGCSSLKSLTIGNSVKTIGTYAFGLCSSLESIIIPDSVTTIDDRAFQHCTSLKSITIGSGLSYIGENAFKAAEINVSPLNTNFSSVNNVLFNKDQTQLVLYPNGETNTSYIIPDSVTSIDNWAFSYATNLTSIIVPDSVTQMYGGVFADCANLKTATIGSGVTVMYGLTFIRCTNLESVTFRSAIPPIFYGGEFNLTPALTTIYVPIGAKAAYEAVSQLSGYNIIEISDTSAAADTIWTFSGAGSNPHGADKANFENQAKFGDWDVEYWSDGGTSTMKINNDGTFEAEWRAQNVNNNLWNRNILFRSGRKFGTPQSISQSHEEIGEIVMTYDVSPFNINAETGATGNAFLCVYGWTALSTVEWYIIEDYGDYIKGRTQMINNHPAVTQKANYTIPGEGTYELYVSTERVNVPSIFSPNDEFPQYIAVRTAGNERTSGTVSVSEHFREWEKQNLDMSGALYEVAFCVEAWGSTGTAKVNSLTLDITPSCTHTWNPWTPINFPNCTVAGEMRRTCSECPEATSVVLQPLGDTPVDTWTIIAEATDTAMSDERLMCARSGCSQPFAAVQQPNLTARCSGEHTFGEWVTDTAFSAVTATCTNKGYRFRVCSVVDCFFIEPDIIPMLAHKGVHGDDYSFCGDCGSFLSFSVSTFDQLKAAIASNTNALPVTIIVTAPITMTEAITIAVGANITLTGEKLTRGFADGDLFEVWGSLTLEDIIIDGNKENFSEDFSSLVYVQEGKFTMNEGAVLQNNKTNGGGGVYAWDSTFIMNGGEVKNNEATENGGGVYIEYGSFIMSGGEINGNTADNGGGVFVYDSIFTMNGGKINGNTADNGGGVFTSYVGFTMNDGEIKNNEALSGGGVFAQYGNFFMNGGEIKNNEALSGGGVFAKDNTFTAGGTAQVTVNTVNNVYLDTYSYITLSTTNPLTDGANIGVTKTENQGVFVQSGASAEIAQYFRADEVGKRVFLADDFLYAGICAAHEASADNCSLCALCDTTGLSIKDHDVSSAAELAAAFACKSLNCEITIMNDINLARNTTGFAFTNKNIVIDLGGFDVNYTYIWGGSNPALQINGGSFKTINGGSFNISATNSAPSHALSVFGGAEVSVIGNISGANRAGGASAGGADTKLTVTGNITTTSTYANAVSNFHADTEITINGNATGTISTVSGGTTTLTGVNYFTILYNRNFMTTANIVPGANTASSAEATVDSAHWTIEGYAFAGWNTAADSSGTAYKAGDKIVLTAHVTLYAQWCSCEDCEYCDPPVLPCNCGECEVCDPPCEDCGEKPCKCAEDCAHTWSNWARVGSTNTEKRTCSICDKEETRPRQTGGGGGGGGSTTQDDTPAAPPVQQVQGTATLIVNIPRAVINTINSNIPVNQLKVSTAGNVSVSVGADFAGQNAVLVKFNAVTNELEFVSASKVGANGNANLNNVAIGDYLVLTFKTGDITGTGEVQTADALAILRHVAGISKLNSIQEFVANGKTGENSTNDALNILRYVAGIIDKI